MEVEELEEEEEDGDQEEKNRKIAQRVIEEECE